MQVICRLSWDPGGWVGNFKCWGCNLSLWMLYLYQVVSEVRFEGKYNGANLSVHDCLQSQ